MKFWVKGLSIAALALLTGGIPSWAQQPESGRRHSHQTLRQWYQLPPQLRQLRQLRQWRRRHPPP